MFSRHSGEISVLIVIADSGVQNFKEYLGGTFTDFTKYNDLISFLSNPLRPF